MIPKLKKRLANYHLKAQKNEELFRNTSMDLEVYYRTRLDLDKKICTVYELDKINIHNEEFTDKQLSILIDGIN